MNTAWSSCIQKTGTLYLSRALRFSDMFREKYTRAFCIEPDSHILELGCGPGALSEALHRWYPSASVTGTDADDAFIEFARSRNADIDFRTEDATALSFDDSSFDVTISHTVSEHVEPGKFFAEQRRVLRPGGVCLMLSARRGIDIPAPCIEEQSEFEIELWQRVDARMTEITRELGVGRYRRSEAGHALDMQSCGFKNISTEYITINLTPDNPNYDRETAVAMINSDRQCSLDAIDKMEHLASDLVTRDETDELRRLVNEKFDKRISLYDAGVKLWDTNVSLTMILRGEKAL